MVGGAFGVRVKADAVVGDGEGVVLPVVDADAYVARLGVFADVGQAFLQNKDELQLLAGSERRAVAVPFGVHSDVALLGKALGEGFYGFVDVFLRDFSAEVLQQLAHVVVAFLDAVFDGLQVFLRGLGFLVCPCVFQHLGLQVQIAERLGDAVVQALGDGVALLQYGVLAAFFGKLVVVDG